MKDNNKMIPLKTEVVVQGSKYNLIKLKEKYIGQKATIREIKDIHNRRYPSFLYLGDGTNVRYVLEFDNKDLQMQNILEGNWLWKAEELTESIEPKLEKFVATPCKKEVVNNSRETYKIVITPPKTIYIINDGDNIFRGVSNCLDTDVFDRDKGIEIAKLRAELQQKSYQLHQLIK